MHAALADGERLERTLKEPQKCFLRTKATANNPTRHTPGMLPCSQSLTIAGPAGKKGSCDVTVG